MREIYFINNKFEFFLINFMLFYGIYATICFCFLLKRIFAFLTAAQLLQLQVLSEINVHFFIRNQNFMKQQLTSTGSRIFSKASRQYL
jgi:hypothetical protein